MKLVPNEKRVKYLWNFFFTLFMIFGACLIKNTKIYIHNLIIRSVHLHKLTSNNCSAVSLNVYTKLSLLNGIGISSSLYSKLLSHVNEHHLCHNVGESGCLENSGSVVQNFFVGDRWSVFLSCQKSSCPTPVFSGISPW